ncbi:MAG: hypothetical protein QM496_06790 [Verrucomicrobiota bacterium]
MAPLPYFFSHAVRKMFFFICAVCLISTSAWCEGGVQAQKNTTIPQTQYDDINALLQRIRSGFDKAINKSAAQRDKKVQELNQKYLKQLEQVQRYYTASGNANAALLTRDEILRITNEPHTNPAALKGVDSERLQKSQQLYLSSKKQINTSHLAKSQRLYTLGNEALKKRASELTRKGDLDRVAALTKLIPQWSNRSDLKSEPQTITTAGNFTATIHFFFKGDIELFHNGKKLSYESDQVQFGTSGISNGIKISDGDIIAFRLRSDAVNRSLIASIFSKNHSRFVPLKLRDYRYIEDTRGVDVTTKHVKRGKALAKEGQTHTEIENIWASHRMPEKVKNESEWITIPQKNDWVTYAIEISSSDIKTIR